MFTSLNFSWPPQLLMMFKALSFASFNLDLLAPECTIKSSYESRWLVTQALPAVLGVSVRHDGMRC